ncbi:MAG: hypothetical protein GY720_11425 [bacterium]|nr:hypothetical protein [bacterium]
MSSQRTAVRLVALAMSLALFGAACSDTPSVETVVLSSTTDQATAPPTTFDPNASIIFGSGSVPDTLPSDFPIPGEAVIGATLIDRNRSLTEVVMRVPAGVEAVAGFFDTNLANRGYTVESSAGDASKWELVVSGSGVSGTVAITLGTQDVSQAVIRVTADG